MPKSNKNPRIFISPINQQIIDAINRFDPEGEKIGLILSQRQHNTDGGYIPYNIIDQVYDMPHLLERDHFHNNDFNNDESHFEYDASVFDVIHLDPWSNAGDKVEGYAKAKATLDFWLEKFNQQKELEYELGTEEFVCILEADKLDYIIENIKSKIRYVVCQGGSVVFNLQNQAPIEIEKTKSFINVARKHGCQTKRHNCDFHTNEELMQLSDLGIDTFNFAPEFTYIYNKTITDSFSSELINHFYKKIILKTPWDRWLTSDAKPVSFLYACLHYLNNEKIIDNEASCEHEKIVTNMQIRMEEIWKAIN